MSDDDEITKAWKKNNREWNIIGGGICAVLLFLGIWAAVCLIFGG